MIFTLLENDLFDIFDVIIMEARKKHVVSTRRRALTFLSIGAIVEFLNHVAA